MRPTAVYLLIAVVLTCPYSCLGKVAGAVIVPCQADGCSCNEHQDRSSSETPELPDDKDADCLCRGAIMGGVRSVDFDLSTPPPVNWLIDDAALSSIDPSLSIISFEPPHHFPPFSIGRDVCALTCALLL